MYQVLEHIVCSNIKAHLDKLLSDRQHAFRKKNSCETQLISVINDWPKILDKGRQVDTFILDFEKTFEKAFHCWPSLLFCLLLCVCVFFCVFFHFFVWLILFLFCLICLFVLFVILAL